MRTAALLAAAIGLSACSHATISNTAIRDTKDNRELLQVFSQYKQAVEAKDVAAIMELVSPQYMDVTIPGKGKDVKDYATLPNALKEQFQRTKSMRLELHPRSVKIEGDTALVDYFYVVRYDPVLPSGTKWLSETDDARLKLVRHRNGPWKIASGL